MVGPAVGFVDKSMIVPDCPPPSFPSPAVIAAATLSLATLVCGLVWYWVLSRVPIWKEKRIAKLHKEVVMKKLIAALLLAVAAPSFASSPLAGRLDLSSMPSIGAWQSLTSADQAVGVSKRLFHMDYAGQPLVNLSVFAGVSKPMVEPATPVRFLAGDVIQVPGSTLDWALGTDWGSKWLPKLKTGILFAHDLSRLSKTHLFGDFIGIGAAYPIGG